MAGSPGTAEHTEKAEVDTDKVLLTVPEAARRLSLGRTTAYQLIRRGELPSIRVGRAVRVPVHALDAWVATHTCGPGID